MESKSIATLETELYKRDAICVNRRAMYAKIKELYGTDLAEEYLRQLEEHEIYRHDETAVVGKPYCASVTLYPFLFKGNTAIGGTSEAPKNLASFYGAFINLVFALAAQFCGAVSTPEWLAYMDYFVRKEYGDDYYLRPDAPADLSTRRRTIDKVITDAFEQVVYSLNQPAAARGNTGMVVARRATSMRMISALRSFIVTVDSPPFPWLWPYAITQTTSLIGGLRNFVGEIFQLIPIKKAGTSDHRLIVR